MTKILVFVSPLNIGCIFLVNIIVVCLYSSLKTFFIGVGGDAYALSAVIILFFIQLFNIIQDSKYTRRGHLQSHKNM